ncbi:MAG: hypothetical protein WDM78_18085 [Puia sp.]
MKNRTGKDFRRKWLKHGAVPVKYNLMFIESKARKIFKVWAGIISKRKKRDAWLVAFKYYLLIALFIAAPHYPDCGRDFYSNHFFPGA